MAIMQYVGMRSEDPLSAHHRTVTAPDAPEHSWVWKIRRWLERLEIRQLPCFPDEQPETRKARLKQWRDRVLKPALHLHEVVTAGQLPWVWLLSMQDAIDRSAFEAWWKTRITQSFCASGSFEVCPLCGQGWAGCLKTRFRHMLDDCRVLSTWSQQVGLPASQLLDLPREPVMFLKQLSIFSLIERKIGARVMN